MNRPLDGSSYTWVCDNDRACELGIRSQASHSCSLGNYLHHNNVLGALALNLGMLYLHCHRPPIWKYGFVDLSEGGGPLRLFLKLDEKIADLRRELYLKVRQLERGRNYIVPERRRCFDTEKQVGSHLNGTFIQRKLPYTHGRIQEASKIGNCTVSLAVFGHMCTVQGLKQWINERNFKTIN